jgi:hypothetical protein
MPIPPPRRLPIASVSYLVDPTTHTDTIEVTLGRERLAPLRYDDLSTTAKDILRAAHQLRAFDHDSCAGMQDIVKRAGVGSPESRNVRKAVTELKQRDLLRAKRGPKGGFWITPEGCVAIGADCPPVR